MHLPAGEIIDHPDCWRLCSGPSPAASPYDKECSDKVLSVLGNPARVAYLAELQANTQPERLKQFSKGEQERLSFLSEQYAEELTQPDAEEPEFSEED